jgi:hypothetical protein
MECSECGLINPDTAERCDCGFDFASKAMKKPYFTAAIGTRQGQAKKPWWFAPAVFTTIWVVMLLVGCYANGGLAEFLLVLLIPLFPLGQGGLAMALLGVGINWFIWFAVFSAIRAALRTRRRFRTP